MPLKPSSGTLNLSQIPRLGRNEGAVWRRVYTLWYDWKIIFLSLWALNCGDNFTIWILHIQNSAFSLLLFVESELGFHFISWEFLWKHRTRTLSSAPWEKSLTLGKVSKVSQDALQKKMISSFLKSSIHPSIHPLIWGWVTEAAGLAGCSQPVHHQPHLLIIREAEILELPGLGQLPWALCDTAKDCQRRQPCSDQSLR